MIGFCVISEILRRCHTGTAAARRIDLAAGRFVEFGCGLGYVTRWAASEGAHATGIDANGEQVKASQELADAEGLTNAEFRTANIYEPGLDPDIFDVAYCRWLMVHLNRPAEAMRSIFRTLKPAGVMVCEEAGVGAIYVRSPARQPTRKCAKITLSGGRSARGGL